MNVVGLDLKEIFLLEFENLWGQFPSSGQAQYKIAKKNKRKRARVPEFPLLEEILRTKRVVRYNCGGAFLFGYRD